MKNHEWTKIGEISVDSGLCYIGDPCHILKEDMTGLEALDMKTWRDFCDSLEGPTKAFNFPGYGDFGDYSGRGVVTCTGWGDGQYDVTAKIINGRVMEVRIVFDED